MTDPIADMLTRIKNAYLARKRSVIVPHSKVKEAIAQVLVEHKYVQSFEKVENGAQPNIVLTLIYTGKEPAMTNLKRLSKPGRRTYSSVARIPKTLGGYGLTIVSTSQGVMSDTKAREKNIGGEVLCQIW